MSYDSVVDLDREEARSASWDAPEYDDDRPTLAECQRYEADAGPPPRHQLPDPYTCTDPWCPSRAITPDKVAAHAGDSCSACAAGRDCTVLVLESQQDHLHGTRPDGVRV